MKKAFILAALAVIVAAAFLAGSRQGKAQYDAVRDAADSVWNDRTVKKIRKRATKKFQRAVKRAQKQLG